MLKIFIKEYSMNIAPANLKQEYDNYYYIVNISPDMH